LRAPAAQPAPAIPDAPPPASTPGVEPASVTTLSDHDVVVGYGRVGALVGRGLIAAGRPLLVVVDDDAAAEEARAAGAEVVVGNAADPDVLAAANLSAARRLFCTVPDVFEAGQVVQQARAANARMEILARAHSDDAVAHLESHGAGRTISGEREIALRMLEQALPDAQPRR
jgi:CPA2 family monovalent cation:H+ antiporter-2